MGLSCCKLICSFWVSSFIQPCSCLLVSRRLVGAAEEEAYLGPTPVDSPWTVWPSSATLHRGFPEPHSWTLKHWSRRLIHKSREYSLQFDCGHVKTIARRIMNSCPSTQVPVFKIERRKAQGPGTPAKSVFAKFEFKNSCWILVEKWCLVCTRRSLRGVAWSKSAITWLTFILGMFVKLKGNSFLEFVGEEFYFWDKIFNFWKINWIFNIP